jgi:murein DD-endopeptidase MepM/ murein hydrolase activator NlpD
MSEDDRRSGDGRHLHRNEICMKLFSVILLQTIFCMSSLLLAQTTASGNIETYVDNIIASAPGTSVEDQNKYQPPSSLQLATWGNTIIKIAEGNYADAHDSAGTIGYNVVQFTHTSSTPNKTYYVLEKTSGSVNYWGTFVYNPSPKRGKLFIQSPHPKYDSNTGLQGIMIFNNVGARAFYVSGTHRCNNTTSTTCSGTSTACGGTTYRISDQAHVVNGPLYQATVTMSSIISQLIVVQNHGFGKDTSDPYVIMGNGKNTAPTGTDYLVQVRDALYNIDNELTFKVAHIDTDWTELTGTTNTEGRFINGSGNPCNSAPSSANGRFLHIEQALDRLRNSSTNRKKLSDAIAAVFAEDGLTLTSPNGGEVLTSGTPHSITWNSTGLVSAVKLEYSADDGKTWNTIVSSAPNTGSYSWTVTGVGTWRAKVRILDAENSSVGDTSNAKFKILHSVYPTTGTTSFVDPAAAFGSRKLSGVYDFHRGIDFAGTYNIPIRPARAGIIVRKEDSSVTAGGGLQRFGTWMLVKIDSANGQARFNAYLHMNGFHTFNVGDTVSTSDTIGYMGKSGYQINTVHLHFELYKNLTGTSIDKDKAKNPMEVLPYVNANSYSASVITQGDSSAVEFSMPETEIDFDAVTIYGSLVTRTVAFNARTGIDPDNNDNPHYNGVFIDPDPFITDSSTQRLRFWITNSGSGTIDSAKFTDINGYSFTVSPSSGGSRFAVLSGNWDGTIWATTSGGDAGSASTPTSFNDVTINSGVTVTINVAAAECKSLSFGSSTAKLSLSSGSVLSVYGNFTLASTTHNVFSSWADSAKLCFKGNAVQSISGFGDFNATNSSFKELQINKNGGYLTTPGAASGNGMCINIVDTLDIINGTFILETRDDIQGRNLTGSSATTPVIIVRSGGTFTMNGSASHIRSGNVSASSTPIGKLFVYGSATLASTSSNGINFSGIDVYERGVLTLSSFSNTQPNNVKVGTLQVNSGGSVANNSTVDFWNASSVVNLSAGALYSISAATTVFPPTFTNNGKVQYSRTASDGSQTIADRNYSSLSIASSGIKSWNLASSRTITDTLEVLAGTLTLTSSAQTVSVQGVLKLTNDTIITGTNTLSLGSSPSNRGTLNYSSGIIVGNFKRWFTTATTDSILFPVGTPVKLRPAAVRFTSAPLTGGTLTASFTGSVPGTSGLPLNDAGTSIVNVTNDGYWTINADGGLSGGTYSLALSASSLTGISDYTSLRIVKRSTGNPWVLDGSHANGVGSNSSPTVRRTGMSGFSEFAIGAASDNPLPVEMNTLSARADGFTVTIEWSTATEVSNYGFQIERGAELEFPVTWIHLGFVNGNGTSNKPNSYSFSDKVPQGGKYVYRIKQIDTGGMMTNSRELTVDVGMMPKQLMMLQNYPNPFNPSTTIDFTIPKDDKAVVRVYNALGQQVAELFNNTGRAGYLYRVHFDASTLPSGIYVVRLSASGSSVNKKMLFVK